MIACIRTSCSFFVLFEIASPVRVPVRPARHRSISVSVVLGRIAQVLLDGVGERRAARASEGTVGRSLRVLAELLA